MSTTVYSLSNSNKNNKISAGSTVLRAQSEKFEPTNCGIAHPNQSNPLLTSEDSSAYGGETSAHRRQRSPYRGGISPFQQQQQQQQPYISGTGGAKRRLSSVGRERDMQQHDKCIGTSAWIGSDDDEFGVNAFGLGSEPKAKQRRYEERMSTKLSGIQLKDEHGKAVGTTNPFSERRTTSATQQPWAEVQNQQRKGPIIEEITDWGQLGDADLLFGNESMFQNGSTAAPIIEEPDEGNPKGRECASAEKSPTGRLPSRTNLMDDCQEEDNELNLDSGCCSSFSLAAADFEREEQQRIELSPELRNLISSTHSRNGAGDGPLATIGRPIRTGKELIPFVPSPSAAFLSSFPLGSSTSENRNLSCPREEDKRLPPHVEEVLDDEILPDAAVGTPQVQSDTEEYWSSTPPNNGKGRENGQNENLLDDLGEENAMEMD